MFPSNFPILIDFDNKLCSPYILSYAYFFIYAKARGHV